MYSSKKPGVASEKWAEGLCKALYVVKDFGFYPEWHWKPVVGFEQSSDNALAAVLETD